MPRNFLPRCKPYPLVPLNVVDEPPQRREASRFPDNTAMQTNREHLGFAVTALLVHDVESRFAIVKPVLDAVSHAAGFGALAHTFGFTNPGFVQNLLSLTSKVYGIMSKPFPGSTGFAVQYGISSEYESHW